MTVRILRGRSSRRLDALPRARAPRRGLLAVAALLALVACRGEPDPGAASDALPLTLDTPGVIAYAAVTLPSERLAALDGLFGGPLEGLRAEHHAVALHLDARVFGGHVALALPLDDEAAFRASFERAAFLETLGGDRYRLHLPAGHALTRIHRAVSFGVSMLSGSQLPSLEHLDAAAELDLPVRLRVEPGYALLGPSLEGAVVTSRALAELRVDTARDAPAMQLAVDVERFVDTYHDLIQQGLGMLRGALTGSRVAGFAGMVGSAMNGAASGGGRTPLGNLPFPPATAWALFETLAPDRVEAVGLRVERLPGAADPDALEPADLARLPADGELLLRFTPDSPERRLGDALRPAPALPDAPFVAHADAPAVGAALGDWLRPFAELLHGDGTVAAAWQARVEQLLVPWDGRAVAATLPNGELVWLLGTHPHAEWDLPAIEAWLRPLAEAFALELPPHDAWLVGTGADVARVGDFTVLSAAALDPARLAALLRELDDADWSGEDTTQPALRVRFTLPERDGVEQLFALDLGRDARTGLLAARLLPPETR